MFHNRHLAEMRERDYSGWRIMDAELTSLYLYGNPKVASSKVSQSGSSSTVKQSCFAFQSGKCSSPCAQGHIHKCKICGNSNHG
ncbi:hypothetical protein JB92DRAFT_3230303, partial [Gautieria morchelliformis]